ncbi:MAG: hypothetical protein ABIA11_00730 [Patescibacteria group bacterium]|nr:hypothetical protein [Patescibacteria group bacterium]
MFIIKVYTPYIGVHKWLSWSEPTSFLVVTEDVHDAVKRVLCLLPKISKDIMEVVKEEVPEAAEKGNGYDISVNYIKEVENGVYRVTKW